MRSHPLIICSLILIFTVAVIRGEDRSFLIAKTNPLADPVLPGGRGENQLVVYTSVYPFPSTGTNEYGIEATINADGRVANMGGNNSIIPQGNLILSGHGLAKDWMLSHIQIGAKVSIRSNHVAVSYDEQSFQFYADHRLKILRTKEHRTKPLLSDVEQKNAARCSQDIESYLKNPLSISDTERYEKHYQKGAQLLDRFDYALSTSPLIEGRGIWHRPREQTGKDVEKTVARFADAGFNMLFVETIWRGEAIYPSILTEQKAQFKGFDPLRAFIEAGKKHGVQIHAWIHTFFVGYLGSTDDRSKGPVLAKHPEWALVNRNGEQILKTEKGYLYVCPARSDVQDFLASLYREVRTRYPDLAGMQLDYIRYNVNEPFEESSCYCQYCRTEFSKFSGIDPLSISPNQHPEAWQQWTLWREEKVTHFVRRIRQENPGVILSAAVFPDLNDAVKKKMQNWSLWAREGYINFLAPMAYSPSVEWVGSAAQKTREVTGEQFPMYIGLAPFLKLTPEILLGQIEASREAKAKGVILFATGSMSDQQLELLKTGPFRNKATVLTSDLLVPQH